ncbi:HNH endonuclease [Candidatus Poribacteria bacterium]|nr:HNH endonuclease [Candidatus Poribacteria bacterium]
MPCKPAKARKLLRSGRAKVVNRCPFTIQLLWDCEENVQEVTVGIDKGSHLTGISGVGNGKILMSGEIHHRTNIKEKMDARRGNRRNRRSRKWYRPRRFDNRASSKRRGRLPPSIKANVEEVIRVVRQIPLPKSHLVIEDVQVDIARLNNPTLIGRAYQESNRLDENQRIATLMRDGYQCTQCGEKNTRLQAHHMIWKEHGGKDTIENLITLCHACHVKVHEGKLFLDTSGVSGFADQIAQRTMQGKAYLYETLGQMAKVSKVFGYQTSAYRKSFDFKKSHDVDALCVATLQTGEVIPKNRENFYTIRFRPRQTRRQYYDLPRSQIGGKGRVQYQVNAELDGFRKGDIVRVKGKWVKQIQSIYSTGYLAFARVKDEPSAAKPKDCQLLQRGQTVIWEKAG